MRPRDDRSDVSHRRLHCVTIDLRDVSDGLIDTKRAIERNGVTFSLLQVNMLSPGSCWKRTTLRWPSVRIRQSPECVDVALCHCADGMDLARTSAAPGGRHTVRRFPMRLQKRQSPRPRTVIGGFIKRCRRRPTLPRPHGRSTIGAVGLNDRVRNGNECGPDALVASELSKQPCKHLISAHRSKPEAYNGNGERLRRNTQSRR